jgi:hypothetical protein
VKTPAVVGVAALMLMSCSATALAFVETAIGTGSGILRGAKLLTNAHVVWP